MNKRISGMLVVSLALLSSSASGLDYDVWRAYCKKSEQNMDRCDTATRLCEENVNADCDKIRTAFMLEQPLPSSVMPSNTD